MYKKKKQNKKLKYTLSISPKPNKNIFVYPREKKN